MTSGYFAACTGLVSRTEALDSIANNLANESTTGFRGRHNIFSSVLASADNSRLSVLNRDANDYGILSGTRLDTTQGSLQQTGNELDVAIEGPGFLSVQTASGVAYTRAGNLKVSPQGMLTTSAGDPVLGQNGLIPVVGAPVTISADGTISVKGAIAGRLSVTEFPPATELESLAGTYFKAPPGVGTAAVQSNLRQGMLESSNVNPVSSVVELISAQREVETMRRVLTMFDSEMDKTAAQDLPRVG